MTDRELIERYQRGEVSAFERLLERHESTLLRFAARYRRGSEQDIVQSVFLRLIREVRTGSTSCLEDRSGRPVDDISAWLFRVTRNLTIDEARKENRMLARQRQAAVAEAVEPASSATELDELAALVESKLQGLPTNQREVVLLRIREHKTYREISELTGHSISNVGWLIHRGLHALAAELRLAGVV